MVKFSASSPSFSPLYKPIPSHHFSNKVPRTSPLDGVAFTQYKNYNHLNHPHEPANRTRSYQCPHGGSGVATTATHASQPLSQHSARTAPPTHSAAMVFSPQPVQRAADAAGVVIVDHHASERYPAADGDIPSTSVSYSHRSRSYGDSVAKEDLARG